MKSLLSIFVILLILQTSYAVFPTPKYQNLSQVEFLEIPNVCMMRHVLPDNEKDSQSLLSMFKIAQTEPNYYLNKIIKRQNNNIDCSSDKILIDSESSNLINIVIQQTQSIEHKEGYILEINNNNQDHILIKFKTYSGYIYALETLSQLLNNNKIPIGKIEDSPLVIHRGVMIDSARHFLQYSTIARLIESLPLAKLNILHWHISDDESFPLKLNSHPQLAEASKFKKNYYYTVDQVKSLIALGKKNGIAIVPEIDSPAHIRSWGLSDKWKKQNITIDCHDKHYYNHQLDLSKAIVYQLGEQIYKEIDSIFRDSPYIHLGGDEVQSQCWDKRPAIRQFMKVKSMHDYGQLQMYWRYQMKNALAPNRTAIFWRNDAAYVKVADHDIMHYWGTQNDTAKYVGNGLSKIILSTPAYLYLNDGVANWWWNETSSEYITWKKIYQGFELFPAGVNATRILGAQVCIWGEVSNDDTLQYNLWMRSAVFAQKLWTDEKIPLKTLVKDISDLQKSLIKMGVGVSPIVSEFCQKFTDRCDL